jgi:hypothetical protein
MRRVTTPNTPPWNVTLNIFTLVLNTEIYGEYKLLSLNFCYVVYNLV